MTGRRCTSPAGASPRSATTRLLAHGRGHAWAVRPRSRSSTAGASGPHTLELRVGLVAGPAGVDRQWCMAGRCAVQVRPVLNGYDLSYRGIRATRLRLHRARGGARRPDAREGAARHLQAAALPHARPGEGNPRAAGPGGQDRRGAVRGGSHEDGEHPARRARRPWSRPSRPSLATASRWMPSSWSSRDEGAQASSPRWALFNAAPHGRNAG